MCDDLDIGCCDMWVGFNEVGSEYRGEQLGWGYGVLFGFDVDSIFHRVGGYDYAVVALCVSDCSG